MGFGWEAMRKINPRIIYVQQSGMGQSAATGGPAATGRPPRPSRASARCRACPSRIRPPGIGYSYLDWFGAYQMAVAMMAGLYRQRMTGEGCWIDSSQVETGLYLTGTSILDYTVNGRRWSRYGNRSPYKPAAPYGAYRSAGTDRWIAITAFTEEQWLAVDPGPRACRSGRTTHASPPCRCACRTRTISTPSDGRHRPAGTGTR